MRARWVALLRRADWICRVPLLRVFVRPHWAVGWPSRGRGSANARALQVLHALDALKALKGLQRAQRQALRLGRVFVPDAGRMRCLFLRAFRAQTAASTNLSVPPRPPWPRPIVSSAIGWRQAGLGRLQRAVAWWQLPQPASAHAPERRRARARRGGRLPARWLRGIAGPVRRLARSWCKFLEVLPKAGPRITQAALGGFKIHAGGLGNLLHA